MKAVISGCGGIGSLGKDTDYIIQKAVINGMLMIAVDASEDYEEGTAQEATQSIIYEWEREPELSEERLEECLENVLRRFPKISVTILVVEKKQMGIAHRGNNKLYHLLEYQIDEMTISKEGNRTVAVYGYTPKAEDAFVLMTDGFAELIREQEVLIDYTKSGTPKELISYLSTRIGLRQGEEYDSYSALALFFE